MAHLELSIPWRGSTKQPRRPTFLKFENRSRAVAAPFNKVAYPAFLEDALKEAGPSFAVAVGAALRQFTQ